MAGSGTPYCSLVNVATEADGAPLLLDFAARRAHAKHSGRPARLAVARDAPARAIRWRSRASRCPARWRQRDDRRRRRRFLARHPEAEAFADFADFAFYRMRSKARIWWPDSAASSISGRDDCSPVADAGALLAAEADAFAHMNEDHADALRLYATGLLGAADGAWRCVGSTRKASTCNFGDVARACLSRSGVRSPAELRPFWCNWPDGPRDVALIDTASLP